MKGLTYINIGKLTAAFKESYGQSFTRLFFVYPAVVALLLLILLQGNYAEVSGVINGFLTSFIPIFATIFSIYTSWAFTAAKSRHAADRYQLIEETCAAILFLIPLDLLALLVSVLSKIAIGDNIELFTIDISRYITYNQVVSIAMLWRIIAHFAYYFVLVDIAFVTLTIVKRSYILLTNEIVLLKETPTTITKDQFDQYYDIAVREIVKTYPADVQKQKTEVLQGKKQEIQAELEEATKDEAFSSYLFVNMIKQQLLVHS